MKRRAKLKVIAGTLKGRTLKMVGSERTRSTKAIVKESFFNTLASEIPNSLFIEAFAGTGSMGIQALSQGAKRAIFLEHSKEAHKILLENVKHFKLESKSEIFLGDSFELLPALMPRLREERAILYLDPPFAIREGQSEIYERLFALLEAINFPSGIVVLEHMSGAQIPQNIGNLTRFKERKFGKTTLSYFCPA
ncbi:MAG: 16S rRNA (guanine(966)-N(2))-methyltransferase RsmD [Wolinella sp.]